MSAESHAPTNSLPPGTNAAGKKGARWEALDLLPEIHEVLKSHFHFESMTPVQAATLPHFLLHKDVAVEAPTGSGKTISFVVPILEKLLRLDNPLKKHEVGAIVITPTRELAMQIAQVLEAFISKLNSEEHKLSLWRLIGGTDVHEDALLWKSQGGNIIVATPGRLEDTLNRMPDIKLKTLEVLVLDEADRLLDMGFYSTITTILGRLPKQRRTGLFSATLTKQVSELVRAGMRNPVKISVKVEDKDSKGTQVIPNTLSNYYVLCEADAKLSFLIHFLKTKALHQKVIVYFVTAASVTYFWKVLALLNGAQESKNSDSKANSQAKTESHGKILSPDIHIYALHGQIPQKKRNEIYSNFVTRESGILLSTDVSARGLDFDDIDWVIQFDPPQDPSFFIHRIGRTARIGRQGNALLFLLPAEVSYLELLSNRKVPIAVLPELNDAVVSIHPPRPTKKEDGTILPPKPAPEYLSSMTDYCPELRQISLKNRDMMEKGVFAFISFIRAYKESHTTYIFRLKDLDIGALARLFGILKLPRMSEINPARVTNFEEADVDMDTIKYTDKAREKQRIAKLKEAEAAGEDSDDGKQGKRSGKRKGFSAEDFGKTSEDEANEEQEESEDSESESDVVGDFTNEATLLKKLKKGKISERTYEKLTGNDDLDEEVANAVKSGNLAGKKSSKKRRGGPANSSNILAGKNPKKFKKK